MSDALERASHLPEPGSEPSTAGTGSRRHSGQPVHLTDPWPKLLDRVGSVIGASGSTLAIIGFVLPMRAGQGQGDGYTVLLLLLLRGNWALTTSGSGGLGWELIPLVFLLCVSVLAGPITLSLLAQRATQRFPRLSLGVFVIGCLLLWSVMGAPFCAAAALTALVAFATLALLSFRNPARSHPWVYALVPLVGLLASGGGMAMYVAAEVHWSLGDAATAESLISAKNIGMGFWLCAVGWLLATLGGTLLWRVWRQARSR